MNIHALVPRSFVRRAPARRSAVPVFRHYDDFDNLFDEFWRGFSVASSPTRSDFTPHIDVSETDDEIVVSAELPGLEEKDFEVTLDADVLTIKGEKRLEHEESDKGFRRVETSSGRFERSFRLGENVDPDGIKASYKSGVLRVTIAKPEETEPPTRTIPVTTE